MHLFAKKTGISSLSHRNHKNDYFFQICKKKYILSSTNIRLNR